METLQELEALEQELQFDSFDADTALETGLAMIEEARRRNNKIAIDIFAFGRTLFHFSGNGNAPSNDEMLRRKRNTTLYTGHSSLWAHVFLKNQGLRIDEKWHLDPSDHAEVGGAFPIRFLKSHGVVGSVTVSGFDHTVDHEMAVYGIKYAIAKQRKGEQ